MDFSRLLLKWKDNYYSELFMLIAEISALVLGIIYARKQKVGRLFIFYIAFDLIILLIGWYQLTNSSISKKTRIFFQTTSNILISFVELFVYYYYFLIVLHNRKIKVLLKYFFIIFTVTTLIYITTRFDFITIRYAYISFLLGAFELLIMIIPCFSYFVQAQKSISATPLSQKPSFWIVSGIFLFSVISIPAYLLIPFINNNGTIFHKKILLATLYYIPFAFNFIFLSKAYLCKKTLTI